MADPTPEDLFHQTVHDLLRSGPTPVAVLVARLVDDGQLDDLRSDGLSDDELGEAVIDAALVDDTVWATADRVLALSALLTDGLVLTHRLTAAERSAGAVRTTPDLVVLDWASQDGLELHGGGRLEYVAEIDHVPGEDAATFAGPQGWLDPFGEGDLLAFTRTARTVTVRRVDADGSGGVGTGDDAREVELLRAAADERIPPGEGEEAAPLVLDALVHDSHAFRRPVRPLGELLESAGLERRGFSFGRAGQPWRTRGEAAVEQRVRQLARTWGFDTCCTRALEQVRGAFDVFRAADAAGVGGATGGQATAEVDARAVAADLAHGGVAAAFAQLAVEHAVPGEVLGRFADAVVAAATGRQSAAALLLAAAAADLRGEPLDAVARLHEALAADPDYGPAVLALADYEIDRGDVHRALGLLRHPNLSPDEAALDVLARFDEDLNRPYRSIGRNDPCPCGSGRKFKACCQRNPQRPLAARLPLLLYKVSRFAGRSDHESRFIGLAAAAIEGDHGELAPDVHALSHDRFVLDLAIFEGGLADQYLAERGELLPGDERELLAQLVVTPRRLWELTEVDPGVGLTLRDDASGEVVVAAERSGSRGHSPGELLVARLARLPEHNQLVGIPVRVRPEHRQATRDVLAGNPDAPALARWYGGIVRAARAALPAEPTTATP